MDASPTKRRALVPLDANTRSPAAASRVGLPMKRTFVQEKEPRPRMATSTGTPAKKPRLSIERIQELSEGIKVERVVEEDTNGNSPPRRQRSNSPTLEDEEGEGSSVFDNSAHDLSQATAITDPDEVDTARVATLPPVLPIPIPQEVSPWPTRRPTISREEARQKAETLRLRLGLASYKVRTGQTDVPLERLQIRRPVSMAGQGPPLPSASTSLGSVFAAAASASLTTTSTWSRSFPPARSSHTRVLEIERKSSGSIEDGTNYGEQDNEVELPPQRRRALSSAHEATSAAHQPTIVQQLRHSSPEKSAIPRLPPISSLDAPQRPRFSLDEYDDADGRLTSSGHRGVAVKELLNVSRG